jgi:Flp pilus assembly protein TadD
MSTKQTNPPAGSPAPSRENLLQAIGKRIKPRLPLLRVLAVILAISGFGYYKWLHRPMTADRYYWDGVYRFEQKQYAFAMLDWQNAVKMDQKDPRPYLSMSKVEEMNGNLGLAADLLGTVLYYHPKHPHIQCRRAQLYGMANRFEMAFTVAQDAVNIEPNCPAAFNAYGMLLEKTGDYAAAATALGRAHQLLPSDHALALDYARLLALSGKHQEALDIVDAEIITKKFPVQANYLEGWILSEYGRGGKIDLGTAISHLGMALVDNPDHTQSLMQLGRIYLKLGNLPGAQTELEHAFKKGPASIELMAALVELYDRIHSPLVNEARQAADKINNTMLPLQKLRFNYVKNPEDLDNNMKLAEAELSVGNNYDAFALVSMVHQKDPNRKDAADRYIEMKTGQSPAHTASDKTSG